MILTETILKTEGNIILSLSTYEQTWQTISVFAPPAKELVRRTGKLRLTTMCVFETASNKLKCTFT